MSVKRGSTGFLRRFIVVSQQLMFFIWPNYTRNVLLSTFMFWHHPRQWKVACKDKYFWCFWNTMINPKEFSFQAATLPRHLKYMKRRVLHHYKIFLTLLGSQAWLLRIVQDHDNRISLQSSWVIVGHDDSQRQSPVAMRRRLSWFASNHWAIQTNMDLKISSRDLLLGE